MHGAEASDPMRGRKFVHKSLPTFITPLCSLVKVTATTAFSLTPFHLKPPAGRRAALPRPSLFGLCRADPRLAEAKEWRRERADDAPGKQTSKREALMFTILRVRMLR